MLVTWPVQALKRYEQEAEKFVSDPYIFCAFLADFRFSWGTGDQMTGRTASHWLTVITVYTSWRLKSTVSLSFSTEAKKGQMRLLGPR